MNDKMCVNDIDITYDDIFVINGLYGIWRLGVRKHGQGAPMKSVTERESKLFAKSNNDKNSKYYTLYSGNMSKSIRNLF